MTRCCGIWRLFEAAGVFDYKHSSRTSFHHPQEQRKRRQGSSVWLAVNGAISILAFSWEKSIQQCLGKTDWLITPMIFPDHGLMLNASLRQEQHKEPQVSPQLPGQKMPGIRLTHSWMVVWKPVCHLIKGLVIRHSS